MNALHIVPAGEGGVSDFASVLSQAMSDRFGIACNSAEGRVSIESHLNHRSDIVILHYSNYGFAPRGCPFWLIRALRKYNNVYPESKVITIFHEVYASGRLWNSSFWLSPAQKWLATQVVQLSAAILTSINRYKERIKKLVPDSGAKIFTLPVYSTVGEPIEIPEWIQRPPRIVVFGGAGRRSLVYQNSYQLLIDCCNKLELEEIIDIGPPFAFPDVNQAIPIYAQGNLPAKEVSKWMLNSRAGFFDYPHPYLGKSTIFAAYCAHGLLPVSAGNAEGSAEDDLEEGRNFISAQPLINDSAKLPEIGKNALDWYRSHSLIKHLELFSRILNLKTNGEEKLA